MLHADYQKMSYSASIITPDGFDFELVYHPIPSSTPPQPVVRRHNDHHMADITLSAQATQFLCAGTAASISSFLYNPLDCLRIRWQVAPNAVTDTSGGLLRYGSHIVRSEGLVSGLWRPGLAANVSGMFLSAAIRFSSYEHVRDGLITRYDGDDDDNDDGSSGSSKHGGHMVAAGLVCGAFAYFVTAPLHLLKTLRQAEKGRPGMDVWGIMSEANNVIKGTAPVSLRGALFTAGQMIGYDGLKTAAKARGFEDGPYLHLLSSVAASFGASFLSAPADLLVARYMSMATKGDRLLVCVKEIYDERGIKGFWRGWSISFLRLTPVMITYSTLYEQFRYKMGLGYLN
mmetsp:Transcript_2745/g.5776  ORF Transcript_2745/g.5776 Transcript_2745/m.5776 type:complete len:344 (-) Transcript_2745:84-1115(-)